MDSAEAIQIEEIRSGRLHLYLYRDLFQVQLDDGIMITAVLPEELFSIYNRDIPLHRGNRPAVLVAMRQPPVLPKIIQAEPVRESSSIMVIG